MLELIMTRPLERSLYSIITTLGDAADPNNPHTWQIALKSTLGIFSAISGSQILSLRYRLQIGLYH